MTDLKMQRAGDYDRSGVQLHNSLQKELKQMQNKVHLVAQKCFLRTELQRSLFHRKCKLQSVDLLNAVGVDRCDQRFKLIFPNIENRPLIINELHQQAAEYLKPASNGPLLFKKASCERLGKINKSHGGINKQHASVFETFCCSHENANTLNISVL